MKFNLTLIDPPSYKYAYLATDLCRAITYGLRSLGHECDMTVNNVDASVNNIIVGTHLLADDAMRSIMESGAKYICVQTEVLFPGTGEVKVMSGFQGAAFESKCRSFYEHALAIWEPYESNERLLMQFDIPPHRFKRFSLGFHEKLVDIEHRDEAHKDIDVLFFGSMSPRRSPILQRLSERLRLVAILDAPAHFRNDLIARAKVNLNIHASQEFRHLSLTRTTYLLNNSCMLVSETSDSHPELESLIIEAEYADLIPKCEEVLAMPNREELARSSFEKFKQMPMTDILRDII